MSDSICENHENLRLLPQGAKLVDGPSCCLCGSITAFTIRSSFPKACPHHGLGTAVILMQFRSCETQTPTADLGSRMLFRPGRTCSGTALESVSFPNMPLLPSFTDRKPAWCLRLSLTPHIYVSCTCNLIFVPGFSEDPRKQATE